MSGSNRLCYSRLQMFTRTTKEAEGTAEREF